MDIFSNYFLTSFLEVISQPDGASPFQPGLALMVTFGVVTFVALSGNLTITYLS